MCAYDESFYRFFIPFSCFGAGVCEILNFLDAVKDFGKSFDETPFVSEGVHKFCGKRIEFL